MGLLQVLRLSDASLKATDAMWALTGPTNDWYTLPNGKKSTGAFIVMCHPHPTARPLSRTLGTKFMNESGTVRVLICNLAPVKQSHGTLSWT
jgi:hypothetical protein